MFYSWKYEANSDGTVVSQRPISFNPIASKKVSLQACSNCRAKKVKCTWESGGCRRCRNLGRECQYDISGGKLFKDIRQPISQEDISLAATKHVISDDSEDAMTSNDSTTTTTPNTSQTRPSSERDLEPMQLQESCHNSPSEYLNDEHANAHSGQDSGTADLGIGLSPQYIYTEDIFWDPMAISLEDHQELQSLEEQHGGLNSTLLGGEIEHAGEDLLKTGTTPHSLGDMHMPPSTKAGDLFHDPSTTDILHRAMGLPSASEAFLALESAGTSSQLASPGGNPNSCRCLHRLVILVDELESVIDNGISSLDGGLAAHKEALNHGARMVRCQACTGRVENMTILSFLVDKLVRMCRYIANACLDVPAHAAGESCTLLGAESNTRIGAYRVDTQEEYIAIALGLLRLQLRRLLDLTGHLQTIAEQLGSDTMSRRLASCNESITALVHRISM